MFKNLHYLSNLSSKFPTKFVIFFAFLFLLWPTIASAQINHPVETNWQGVTTTLVTCQQDLDQMFVVDRFPPQEMVRIWAFFAPLPEFGESKPIASNDTEEGRQ